MKKILLLLTITCSCEAVFAGKPKDKKKVRVHQIVYDYQTKTFESDSVCTTLNVRDWVSIQVKNMPQSAVVSSSITYTNRHLEDRAAFGNFMKIEPATPSEVNDRSAIKHNINNIIDSDLEIDKATNMKSNTQSLKEQTQADSITTDDTVNKSSFLKSGTITNEKNYKVNETNMEEALDISVAKRFITDQTKEGKNSAENIAEAKKALEDIIWQSYLINNLKRNLNNKIEFRNKLIYDMSTKIQMTTTYPIPVVQIENYDFSEFQISVTDTGKSNTPEVISLPFRNTKGFKLDFSTGLALSGLGNKSYTIVESEREGFVQIKENDENFSRLSMGISLLAHAYFRNARFTNVGITSGLTVNISNQSLNYVLGGSLLLGEDQRFIISAGAIFGKAEHLKSYYKTNTDIRADKLRIDQAVPVIEQFRPSVFFGVSYNLGIANASKKIQL